MRQVVIASRKAESRPASSRGLGPARMARPSACMSASKSDSSRSRDSGRNMVRSLVASSRNVPARSSMPARSSASAADSSSVSSSGETPAEPANHIGAQPPTALGVVRIDEIEGPEHRPDRVRHALGDPPADGEVGPNVVQRQSAGRPLEAHRESHEVLYPFVTHYVACVIICLNIPE